VNAIVDPPYPNRRYAWYVVAILFLAYTSSFIDRQIMALLVEPIKRDLDLNDTQFSLLHGFAFAIFYTFMGLPLGRLADHKNRKVIIAAGILVWSFLTAVCGLAKTFMQLFLARIGVGIGEAALSPAAYSMISDLFPKERRSLPTGMYSMGVFFGAGVAFILGGYVVELASAAADIVLPVVGTIRPWQLTFFIVGLPGLLVVALMLTVREPVRHDVVSLGADSDADARSVRTTLHYVRQHLKLYVSVTIGFALLATASYGFFTWTPSFLIRTFGWQASDAGYAFGLLVLTVGTSGTLFGGIWSDYLFARRRLDANMRVGIYAGIGILVFGALAPLMPTAALALVCLAPTVFFLAFSVGLAPAAASFISPNQFRGQAIALYLFATNLIGLGIGPTIVAVLTDYVFGDPAALKYSLSVFSVAIATLAILTLLWGIGRYRERAAQMLAEPTTN
jgi:MFS family permease